MPDNNLPNEPINAPVQPAPAVNTGVPPIPPAFDSSSPLPNIPPVPPQMPTEENFPNHSLPMSTENVEVPPPPIVTNPTEQQGLPPDNVAIPPVITTPTSTGGGKLGGKKGKIAAIVGVILLIGAVGAGVVLVGRDQDFREKASGLPFPPVGYQCKNGGTFQGKCKLVYCPQGCGSDNKCIPGPMEGGDNGAYYEGIVDCNSFSFGNNVCGQADIVNDESPKKYCARQDGDSSKYTDARVSCLSNCSGTPAKPTPEPSPTPIPERPDLCGNLTPKTGSLKKGDSITFNSTTKEGTTAQSFWFYIYNNDNEYGEGNPKPLCVKNGDNSVPQGDANIQGDCPDNSHHLQYKDKTSSAGNKGSRSLSYGDLFIKDEYANAVVKDARIMGYFFDANGQLSVPQGACASNIKAQESTPPPTPKPTPTPTPEPTNPPIGGICRFIRVYRVKGSINDPENWHKLTADQLTKIKPGEVLYFTVMGTVSSGNITKARFSVETTSSATNWKTPVTTKKPGTNEYYFKYDEPVNNAAGLFVKAQLYYKQEDHWF